MADRVVEEITIVVRIDLDNIDGSGSSLPSGIGAGVAKATGDSGKSFGSLFSSLLESKIKSYVRSQVLRYFSQALRSLFGIGKKKVTETRETRGGGT